ncbi:retrovirus-related pol polyprotein from transposon TNT 1-94 [Tanacetum coccineum]
MSSNRMFLLDFSKEITFVSTTLDESELWHLRYDHLNIKGLQLLKKRNGEHSWKNVCEGCILGKQSKKAIPVGKSRRADDVLKLINADLCGPIRVESLAGKTFEHFRKFKAMVEKQSGKDLKVIQTDRGGEFLSKEFVAFCDDHGIKRELTALYSLEQNGVAERKNLTVVEITRSMLKTEGVATAVYLLNISPTKAVWNETPYEAWCGNKPLVSHLRVFGCICYALRITEKHKLEDKSQKFIFVGYCTQSKAYRLYDPTHENIVVSRNVVFDESSSWRWDNDTEISNSQLKMEEEEVLVENAANDTLISA